MPRALTILFRGRVGVVVDPLSAGVEDLVAAPPRRVKAARGGLDRVVLHFRVEEYFLPGSEFRFRKGVVEPKLCMLVQKAMLWTTSGAASPSRIIASSEFAWSRRPGACRPACGPYPATWPARRVVSTSNLARPETPRGSG